MKLFGKNVTGTKTAAAHRRHKKAAEALAHHQTKLDALIDRKHKLEQDHSKWQAESEARKQTQDEMFRAYALGDKSWENVQQAVADYLQANNNEILTELILLKFPEEVIRELNHEIRLRQIDVELREGELQIAIDTTVKELAEPHRTELDQATTELRDELNTKYLSEADGGR